MWWMCACSVRGRNALSQDCTRQSTHRKGQTFQPWKVGARHGQPSSNVYIQVMQAGIKTCTAHKTNVTCPRCRWRKGRIGDSKEWISQVPRDQRSSLREGAPADRARPPQLLGERKARCKPVNKSGSAPRLASQERKWPQLAITDAVMPYTYSPPRTETKLWRQEGGRGGRAAFAWPLG